MPIQTTVSSLLQELANATLTRTSLQLPERMAIEDWHKVGERIFAVSEASVWWLGDWLVFGERHYPDRYKQAIRRTSLDYQTLRNYAWAARKFPPARRRDKLSLAHHVEVAALASNAQEHWLDLAVRFGWSRDELRRQLRASTATCDSWVEPQPIALSFSRQQVSRWKAAAATAGLDLTEWIADVLDSATNETPRRRSA